MFGKDSKHHGQPEEHGKDRHAKHPERNAWIEDKKAHGGDPPYPMDGSLPPGPEPHHGDPDEMNRDTRFKEFS